MNILIDELIKQGVISEEQFREAKVKQIGAKKPLQDLLVDMGFVSEDNLIQAAARVFNMPVFNLAEEVIDKQVTKLITYEMAKRYGVLVVRKENDAVILAMSDPVDIEAIDAVKNIVGMEVTPVLSLRAKISEFIEKYYYSDDMLYDLMKNIVTETKVELIDTKDYQGSFDVEMVKEGHGPVEKLINFILSDAVRARASDIHIEPREDSVKVRFRVDGDLRNIIEIPRKLHNSVIARIKVMANLDVAESRKTQDGRSSIIAYDRAIDLRVSMVPSYYGEKVVLRLLDPKEAKIQIDRIGMLEAEAKLFKEAISQPQGIILVTGPTGSGKTSTLYAALNFVKNETKNIITIEDPIEYLMEGITQIQTNPIKDVTFANSLRSVLRQDPNIILVGEIRDKETADIAFRASLTGHMVFSTLHTNNAAASITRLLDIGLEPHIISSSLALVVAQRLTRMICTNCKEEYKPEEAVLDKFRTHIAKFNITKFYKGKGCRKCGLSGFYGRTAIFEMMKLTEKIKDLIHHKASEIEISEEAKKGNIKLLVDAGVEKVAMGLTTLEEIATNVEVFTEDKPATSAVSIEFPKEEKSIERTTTRILIVDDEDDLLDMLESRLMAADFEVIRANNGQQAIESAIKNKPNLIIIDVMMPVMDGLEATKVLRSSLETATIPIIMLTAKRDVESELKGLDAGADDYMGKPFDGKRLIARINLLLKRKPTTI